MKNRFFAFAVVPWLVVLTLPGPARGAGTAENANDLMATVLLGCRSAASAVSTSVGKVHLHEWYWRSNGELLETEAVYSVASSGDRFKVAAEVTYLRNDLTMPGSDPGLRAIPPQTVVKQELSYDGERVISYTPAQNRAVIADTDSSVGRDLRQIRLKVLSPGLGVPTLAAASPLPDYTRTGPYVLRREVVDGEECIVVEFVDARPDARGGEVKFYSTSWINPQRGFTLSRGESRAQGGPYGEGTLLAQAEVETRQCGGGLWGISEVEREQYALDSSGRRYLQSRTITTFDPGYRLNAPVTKDMLTVKLPPGTKVHNELLDEQYTVR